jgi:hypothetical protein
MKPILATKWRKASLAPIVSVLDIFEFDTIYMVADFMLALWHCSELFDNPVGIWYGANKPSSFRQIGRYILQHGASLVFGFK